VVFVSTLDGVMRFLDSGTGLVIGTHNVGGSLLAQPAVASDDKGNTLVIFIDMGSSRWGAVFPGFVQALGVSATSVTASQGPTQYIDVIVLAAAVALLFIAVRLVRPSRALINHSPN
jgi:hypothetical protein